MNQSDTTSFRFLGIGPIKISMLIIVLVSLLAINISGCYLNSNIRKMKTELPSESLTPDLTSKVAPSNLSYGITSWIGFSNDPSVSYTPTFSGEPTSFTISPALPAGVQLDPITGVLSGAPIQPQTLQSYTITAANEVGSTTSTFQFIVYGGFTVNSVNDTNDITPGDGSCLDMSNNCTLRAAIQEANSIQSTLSLKSKINSTVTGTITLTLGQIPVSADVEILGNSLTVSGNNLSRVFNITGADVKISSLTIRDGYLAGDGAGIYHNKNTGTLSLKNVIIRNNGMDSGCCSSFYGGGLWTNGNIINIENSEFISNSTGPSNNVGYGGGIALMGGQSLTIEGTKFVGNSALRRGGGIYTSGGTASNLVSIRNSHFESNAGGTHAGAIENWGDHSILIENSSFLNDTGDSGAIANLGSTITIRNSTIITNADEAVSVISNGATVNIIESTLYRVMAGGNTVINFGDPLDLTLTRSIIANGGASACSGGSGVVSNGYNIATDATCGLSVPGDLPNQILSDIFVSSTPTLVGNTYVLPLKFASPAIDEGGTTCSPTDQRGLSRSAGGFCDIGAYEVQ